jgi:hypothetical protein
MLIRLVHAIAVGFIVGLICLFLAAVLPQIHVPVITSIAHFLGDWAWPIGIVAGLLDFASGGFGPSFGGSNPA